MRKILIVGIIAFALIASAGLVSAATTEYTSTVTITGNNIDWGIHTTYGGLHDSFEGTADSGTIEQVFTDHREEWNNFKDIERNLVWSGEGTFAVNANFNNPEQWYKANVDTWVYGESDDGGSFWQRKLPTGHSEPTYKHPSKRGIELNLQGEYELGYGAYDMRGDDSGWDFAFTFDAIGDTDSFLNVEEGNIGSEHGSGQWHVEDRYFTNYDFHWGGTLISQTTNVYGYNSVAFSQTEDFTHGFMFGHALIQ